MGELESALERKLGERLKKAKCGWYKWVSPGSIGVPDRIAVFPGGRVIFVEMKAESGHLGPVQELQIQRLEKLGCEVRVVKGSAGVLEFCKEMGI